VSVVIVSKDEPSLADTLDQLPAQVATVVPGLVRSVEVIVVDASRNRLRRIREAYRWVDWVDFVPPEGVRVSIAHQRNVGLAAASGGIVVFTDCGCIPEPRWLEHLIEPIVAGGEQITCGQTGATGAVDPHSHGRAAKAEVSYLAECPTINLALRSEVAAMLGGFDEAFEYGSDIDFSWRAVHRGLRIRYVPDAVVAHDWGSRWRHMRRSFESGKGRARLYHKHVFSSNSQSIQKRHLGEHDAVSLLYPVYLVGLPIALRHPSYLLLLAIPLWRARGHDPLWTLVDHLTQGAGVLAGAYLLLVGAGPKPPATIRS